MAREDDVQRAKVADRQPPGIHNTGTNWPRGLREDDRVGTPPAKQLPAVAAGFELPTRLAEAPRALGHPQGWTVFLLDREADAGGITCWRGTRRPHTYWWPRMYASSAGSFILVTASSALPRMAFVESSRMRSSVSRGWECKVCSRSRAG
jgi:hypothetical protein